MAEYIVGVADDSVQDIDRLHREYAVNGRIVRCKDCRFRDDPNSVISEWLPCHFVDTPNDWYCASGRTVPKNRTIKKSGVKRS